MKWPLVVLAVAAMGTPLWRSRAQSPKQLDPAAWGGDHVSQPVPEYVTGDECLFCHRADVGPNWLTNRHHLTVREADPNSIPLATLKKSPALKDFADAVKLVLGGNQRLRFLKQSTAYGKLDLLSAEWVPGHGNEPGKLSSTNDPRWDSKLFADSCAGCHTTAVEPKTGSFSAIGLDCFACHGSVDVNHSKDTALVHLSKKRQDPARVVTAICAQCHIRTGKSASSGRPYPSNFVAGDNLFRDFKVDLSQPAIARQNPADRHILENIRAVVVLGNEEVTCLSCHNVHKQSAKKHHLISESGMCATCHEPAGSKKNHKTYEVHSQACSY